MVELVAKRRRMEAEIMLANYRDVVEAFLNGEAGLLEDSIVGYRHRVADVLDQARSAGANVSDLTEQWMTLSQKAIEEKNKLRE